MGLISRVSSRTYRMNEKPSDGDDVLNTLKVDLKAILVSAQQGLTIDEIKRDYETITSNRIPYRKLGYDTLEQFLQANCKDIMSKTSTGKFKAKVSAASAHISKLVQEQRKSDKNRASCMKDMNSQAGGGNRRMCASRM